jgi:sodium-independent sulfate anion transporter 11
MNIQAFGKRTDATQEMIALGIGNILGSFFGAMPITSSFGRSSVQNASGVKTPLSNVYAGNVKYGQLWSLTIIFNSFLGILVLLALGFLMPTLAYIPKAILAAVIITSVIFMVELEELKPMWKSRSKFTSCIAFTYDKCL